MKGGNAMSFIGKPGVGGFFGRNDLLALILVILLFSCDGVAGLFNEETLAVIIILWLIYQQGTVLGCSTPC